ncbi:DNA polymerase III subunit alpha [Liquorilactobacillus oeni]|uniref:DNA-directed DNA polymerase n=1 Tax=Liquorilactobacillus oeni DSM 19972 TaxID=1423777 RepID=A0A0R1MK86_9LACO|nr:DNA polymerase III subunit alpha [Liquorilactobacillus oeni]KRL04328.1 DNA-directed DNA polymerase III alpha subunit [Liquorilactobacillus oeni DSM 19972]
MAGILQVISSYSLLQGTIRINELVQEAKKRGYNALALTDINVMYGALAFYRACQAAEIKPILGLTLEVAPNENLVLLAENEIGYRNLIKYSTKKQQLLARNERKFDFEVFSLPLEGIYIITPVSQSSLIKFISQGEKEKAKKFIKKIITALGGKDKFLLGVDAQMTDALFESVLQLANKENIKTAALDQVRYLNKDDVFELKTLTAIKTGKQLGIKELQYANKATGNEWLRTVEQLNFEYRNKNRLQSLKNTTELCRQLNLNLKFPKTRLPRFKTPESTSANDYLRSLCYEGLKKRLAEKKGSFQEQDYHVRLEHELKIIHRMGFADYFLIVWDVTNFAHRSKIIIGPGRGSAAGSLVSYTLAITDVDPLEYKLLFERFLNEERAQMPDIDLDIPDNRRQEVISYVHKKYGAHHMAQIITFGTLGAKQVLRDVGRVQGLNQFEMNKWSGLIPRKPGISLREAYHTSERLRSFVKQSEKNLLLFKTAYKLEGLPRHFSIHAAGIVLCDEDLERVVPLQPGNDGIMLTQYAKDDVEKIGLLKIDFLGLRNLSILAQTLAFVKRGYDLKLQAHQLPLEDAETLHMFQRADTTGIFQFESAGIKNVLQQLHPTSFEDIAAVNALFRPGPMQNIAHFIARKHGKEEIVYPDKSLKPILQNTYGILVYQEQVMQVASAMGGFSLGQADLLRRAMSKKKKTVIQQMQAQFIAGAQKMGYPLKTAKQVYDYIEKFANYGFNRSHAVAYSKMAFQLAYLKCHFPAAFFAALLNTVIGDSLKTNDYLVEAKQHGVTVSSPNINKSSYYFILKKKELVFGLGSIKTLRRDFIKQILIERKQNGKFRSFQNFLQRIDNNFLKEEPLEALISVGVFDSFQQNRATLLNNLSKMLSNVTLSGNNLQLFAALAPKYENFQELSLEERLENEKKYLGIYLSAHPVEKFKQLALQEGTTLANRLRPNTSCKLLLYLKKIKIIRTKKGEQMAFAMGEDQSAQAEITIFPNVFRKVQGILETNKVFLVTGKTESEMQSIHMIASEIVPAKKLKLKMKGAFYLRLDAAFPAAKRRELLELLLQHHGETPVVLYEEKEAKKWILDSKYWLKKNKDTDIALGKILGQENVAFQNENS